MALSRTKRLSAVLALTVLTLAGCGGGSDEPAEESEAPEESAESEAPDDEPEEEPAEEASEEDASADGAESGDGLLPDPEVTDIQFGYSALEPHSFAIEYAAQLGLFEQYGIESFESFYFDGTGPSAQALVADQVQAITTSGGPVLSAGVTSTPFVATATTITRMTDALLGAPGIETAEDLRGGSVAISQFGGESHAVVLLALAELGLTPEDVTIVQVGGQSDRIAAMLAGSVQAAPVDQAQFEVLSEEGVTELVRLSETDQQLARQVIVFTQEFADANPGTVTVIVGAALEALHRMYEDVDAAVDGYMEWTQISDRDQAALELESYLDAAQRDFRWSIDGWNALGLVQEEVNPAVADVDPEDVTDASFLDALEASGFTAAVSSES